MTDPVERFREILRIPTVKGHDDGSGMPPLERMAQTLARFYPALHEVAPPETVGAGSLLLRWPGQSDRDPIVLMAHMDVVPADPAEWEHDPFAATLVGEGEDAVLHARGAIDDKGALVAICEAAESLAASGFTPAHDVYFSFGHDEETQGGGARAIAELLAARGVRPVFVLDEGGAVVTGAMPGVEVPTAMIGVAERGQMTLTLEVLEAGGHASTPPAMPATARLARAIDRLRRHPFPPRLTDPVRAMLATLAPVASPALRRVFGRLSVTAPLVVRALSLLGPETNAMVRTTAVATELWGSSADNVLATSARASINIRTIPGDTTASATAHVRRAIADESVTVRFRHGGDSSPVSPWRGPQWRRVARAVRATLGDDVVPTPYLQSGAADARWFAQISPAVYRFTPFLLSRAERDALHAPNERIGVATWLRGIAFYREIIAADSAGR